MDSNSRFCSKMSKVENLLSIINSEVDSAIKLLKNVKEHSYEMVETLRKMPSSSSVFLKEFLEINSFLLKYLDFVTEINCKFEIMQTSKKEERMNVSFQNSNFMTGAGLKSSKSESDVNFNDNSLTSIALSGSNTLDYFTDIGSGNSTETSCADLKQRENKNKNTQKIQNKNLVIANGKKEDSSNKKFQSPNTYRDDKQILCDGVQVYSSEPSANELIEKMNDLKNGLVFNAHPLTERTESEDEGFETSFKNEYYPFVKNSINKNTFNTNECKTPSTVEENSLTDISYTTMSDMKRITEIGSFTRSSDDSLRLVSSEQLVGCNDKLFEIRPFNISRKIGEEYKVEIEHITSPSEFYVYIFHSNSHLFAELEYKLKFIKKNQDFSKKQSKECLSQVFGKYALYYSKCDEIWCRAKITDWRVNQKDDLVYIFLLDYGESKCVILDDLQPMPDCFKLYPAFVQRCHLSGILPMEVNSNSKFLAWSKAASEKMKCLVDTSEDLKIKIAPEDIYHPPKSLPVTLWMADQKDSCINDLLVKSQQAQLARRQSETVCDNFSDNENLEEWNPMKEDFESYLNSYDLDMKDPAAIIYGYVGRDYERICKHFAKTGQCFKGESCIKEHIPYNPSGFTTDKEEVYKNAVNALPLPEPKSVISVQVTCILSSNLFCCIRDELTWSSEDETLQSLVQYMNSNENIQEMKKLLIPPSVGQLVIAQYSQDGSWYRAKILESLPESDQYLVFFVDYGNKEILPLSCIRAIEGRYLHLPFQVMQCYIFGITHNPKISAKECMNYLNERITEDKVSIEVVASFPGDHPRLLVNVFDQNGKNIATELITKEYAVFKQELLVNSESTSIPG